MVDARMGSDELQQERLWTLSDRAWRIMGSARMWCNGAGTDGRLRRAFFGCIHPDGVPDDVAAELVAHGHWKPADDGDGYWVEWDRQTLASEVEAYLKRKRVNQRRYRARMAERARAPLAAAKAGAVAGNETTPAAGNVTGHVGTARPGAHLTPVLPPPVQGGGGRTGTDTRAHAREDRERSCDPPDPQPGSRAPAPAATVPDPVPASQPPVPARQRPGQELARQTGRELAKTKARQRLALALTPAKRGRARTPQPAPDDPWRQLSLNLWLSPAPWAGWDGASSASTGEPVPLPTLDQIAAAAYATYASA